MNKNSPNTEEILDAIKNMMSETSVHHDEGLPKDVIELTAINFPKTGGASSFESHCKLKEFFAVSQ